MSFIICIEAGTNIASVALVSHGKCLALRENSEGRQHAQLLAVYVDEMLREFGLTPRDLAAVAVGKGPGSYTGLRIAVSLAKGICFGAGIPLIAVNSLEALCRVAMEDAQTGLLGIDSLNDITLLPMIDARRMEVYCQCFDWHAHPLTPVEAHILTPESFAAQREKGRLLLFGDGASKCKALFAGDDRVLFAEVISSARGLVEPAVEALKTKQFEDTAYFEPFYLKDFVITPSLKKIF